MSSRIGGWPWLVTAALTLAVAVGLAVVGLGTPAPVVPTPTPIPASPAPAVAEGAATAVASPTAFPTGAPTEPPPPIPTPAPRPPAPAEAAATGGGVVEKGSSGRMEIALTFDAGADRGNGADILDRLAAYGVRASFGITGQWAEANPDLVRRMVDEGHMMFNHTWSHRSWTGLSTSSDPEDPTTWEALPSAERIAELNRTAETIRALVGYELAPYWRPAYGDYDAAALADAAAAGYPVAVMWSCESFAWKGWAAPDIVYHCTTDMAPGDIILLHVGSEGTDYDALPGLIEGLRAQGFAFVTIDEILQP